MKKIDLNPTIYAFGFPVPSYIRWPLMGLMLLTLGTGILFTTLVIIPPLSMLAAAIIGIALVALKYYFKMAPAKPEMQSRT